MRTKPETKRVLLTVKACPETSKTYGATLCTAGITEEGEWIRLYPVPFSLMMQETIPRYSWIEVECFQDSEHDKRKESYKIVQDTLRVIENPKKDSKGKVDWEYRNRMILPLVSKSMQELITKTKTDNTSLGLIKPVEVRQFYLDTSDEKEIDYSSDMQMLLFGEKAMPILTKIPHYSYDFKCAACVTGNCVSKGWHSNVCLDWEMGASLVKWKEKNPDKYEKMMQEKFFDFITKRDLYFFMGTHHIYNTWMIIGLYYPPKSSRPEKNLNEFF